ncbi:MAG: PEP-CTERM sorting domain-containing protein [Acidobacteria bacterium]|nr:PEP-CTERM sorting domain-containing protein [Acidobacteriota bacterium]
MARRLLLSAWVSGLCTLVWVSGVSAAPQQVDVWGVVSNVLGGITTVKRGDPFQATFVYEPSSPLDIAWSTPSHGYYFGPLLSASFNVGNGAYATASCLCVPSPTLYSNEIQICDLSYVDVWQCGASNDGLAAPSLDGFSLYSWMPLSLWDEAASVFSDVQLRPTIPPITQFQNCTSQWSFAGDADTTFWGTVLGYTVTPVPEPATLGLFALGLLASLARRRQCLGGQAT